MDIRREAVEFLRSVSPNPYEAGIDIKVLTQARAIAKDMCHHYNYGLRPSQVEERDALLRELFDEVGQGLEISAPFWCDYGLNISVGDNCFFNHNTTILDCGTVTFGDNVFVAPHCVFTTAAHPIDAGERNAWYEYDKPIVVESNVWIGANVTVLPGVRIGEGSVVGAGSVVTRDVPPGVVNFGNPCRVHRPITEADAGIREKLVNVRQKNAVR